MIVAIGAFDGIHLGHKTLLDCSRKRAEETGVPWGVVTFIRHPENLLAEREFNPLFLLPEQEMIRCFLDIPVVHRLSFNREFADMAPEAFLDFLGRQFGVTGVVVGEDFRFGRRRSGTLELLARECRERRWSLDVMPLLSMGGEVVSSSRIRDAVSSGEMEEAERLLGYPFFFRARVIHGDGRGRQLGYPTANLQLPEGKLVPPQGVYAALVRIEDRWVPAGVNIGRNPTFESKRALSFEVHLTDYNGDLYGIELTVFLLQYLRREKRFDGVASLLKQMGEDVARADVVAEASLSAREAMWRDFAYKGCCSGSPSVL